MARVAKGERDAKASKTSKAPKTSDGSQGSRRAKGSSAPRRRDGARRTLLWCLAALVAMGALVGVGVTRADASWTPRLGLDLAGGTQIILQPRDTGGGAVSSEQVEQARDIITQRIDAQGTSGAEVTTQGGENIVVSIPERLTDEQREAITASSQMQFRPVLATGIGDPEAAAQAQEQVPVPTEGASPSGSGTPSGSGSATSGSQGPSASQGETPAPSGSATTGSGGAQSIALQAEAPTTSPSGSGSGSGSATSGGDTSGSGSGSGSGTGTGTQAPAPGGAQVPQEDWTPSGEPTGPLDPNNISTELWQQFTDLDCTAQPEGAPVVTDAPIAACSTDGSQKYLLGPVVVPGAEIEDATAGYQTSPQGQQTNNPEIQLSFKSTGRDAYGDISSQMVQQPQLPGAVSPPGSYNALATVLDSEVLLAPYFSEAITNGQASIQIGNIDEARSLAQSLKFGALPISFTVQSDAQVSPTLGSEQLQYGIIAGIIGLLLVVLYSVVQYRALSMVAIGSMLVAFAFTYLVILLLAWQYNFRLDMAGVTGLIIAIGVTADSFIVYFERVRDELREGRNLRAAVEAGWHRAKRTILVADGVNLVAAVVLYVLASSSVRGFALTLGLTTLIDLVVFWIFTHPLLTVLARRPFFASRSPWSGFDVGAVKQHRVRYTGAGQVQVIPGTASMEGRTS